jgi:UDP-N-acetylglucosamine transferase subunit ALG13
MKSSIYTQWEDPQNNKAIYIGPIFKQHEKRTKYPATEYVFVTVGTRDEPFTRLIKGVEDLVKKGVIKEKVIIQAGHTKYRSDCVEVFDFCGPEKIDELILNAKYVITQESAGIGTQCLKYSTRFVVMPRDYHKGELPAKSDMKEDLQDKLAELGYTKVVKNASELEQAIVDIHTCKTGFEFNNQLAIANLHKAMEEG